MSNITIITICTAVGGVCVCLCGIILIIITRMEEKRMEWIYCKDELPEEQDYYLVTIVNSWSKSGKPFIGLIEFDASVEEWDLHEYAVGYGQLEVIAWMPCPDPAEKIGK